MNLKQYITLYKRVFDSACCQQIIDRSNQSSHTKHTWYNPYRVVESISDDLEPEKAVNYDSGGQGWYDLS